jgi:hypothetical protein
MKKIILSLSFALALSACFPTAEGYQQLVSDWYGSPESELVGKWGVPQATYEADGTKFLTYRSTRNVYIPGTAPTLTTTMIGNTAYTNSYGGTSAQNISMRCETTFQVRRGKVTQATFRGNDCLAMPRETPQQ